MQTTFIPVCHMSYFMSDHPQFYMSFLEGFSHSYPLLFRSFKAAFYMLCFIEKGRGEVRIDQHRIIVDEAQAFVIKPGDLACFDLDPQTQGVVICFDESFFALRYHDNVLRTFDFFSNDTIPYTTISLSIKQRIEAVIDLMYGEFKEVNEDKQTVLRSYLNILLFELNRVKEPEERTLTGTALGQRMKDFEVLVEHSYKVAKTPSFYAEKLYVSPNYLNKICKQERGCTAGDFIRKRVILEAQRLLQFTTLNINEIAQELLFENTSYFVTFFKKYTGSTPDTYRRLNF